MSTWKGLIENTRRHLMGQQRSAYNALASSHDNSTTTILFDLSLDGIARGNVVAIDDELVFIISVDATAKSAEVIRGFWNTTPASHDAGALVELNPRFPVPLIRKELITEIRSWAPDLFVAASLELSVGATARAVDLDGISTDWLHMLRVLRAPTNSSLNNSWVEISPCRAERGMPAASFPSGAALFLPGSLGSTTSLLVTYARDFDLTATADDDDLLVDNLVDPHLEDIAEYGAAWRLIVGREVRRTFTEGQGEPRNAAEVPPGAVIASARTMKQLRDERLADASRRLHHQWGVKVTG